MNPPLWQRPRDTSACTCHPAPSDHDEHCEGDSCGCAIRYLEDKDPR